MQHSERPKRSRSFASAADILRTMTDLAKLLETIGIDWSSSPPNLTDGSALGIPNPVLADHSFVGHGWAVQIVGNGRAEKLLRANAGDLTVL
jgi:hypothetical protein